MRKAKGQKSEALETIFFYDFTSFIFAKAIRIMTVKTVLPTTDSIQSRRLKKVKNSRVKNSRQNTNTRTRR